VKLHLLLDHDGYLPTYALITNGKKHDVTMARKFPLARGSIVAMDRGYNDYELFAEWTENGIFFVTRLKDNADYVVVSENDVAGKENILSDQFIEITGPVALKKCPYILRRVVVWDEKNQRELVLLTNHLEFSATTISGIYKERWQIELFFKAIKQNLRIKTFVGTSENALYIQIWTALISILLLKYMQFRSKIDWSLSNLVALLRWNLFSHKDLWAWLDNPYGHQNDPPEDKQILLPFKGFGQHLKIAT
jgi:IS4 transposase